MVLLTPDSGRLPLRRWSEKPLYHIETASVRNGLWNTAITTISEERETTTPSVEAPISAADTKALRHSKFPQSPQSKQKMSVAQIYSLAYSAGAKLAREAARPDHDLRLVVGHANMLDSLIFELENAKQEPKECFHNIFDELQEEEEDRYQHTKIMAGEAEHAWVPESASSSEDESEEEELDPTINITIIEVNSDTEDDDEGDQRPDSCPDLLTTRASGV